MDDKRNIILAVVLTIGILFGWPLISNYFFPPSAQPIVEAEQQAQQPGAAPNVRGGPMAEGAQAIRPIEAVLGESQRVAIETPKLRGSINLRGARIDDVVLPSHRQTVEEGAPPVRLFSPSGTNDAYFASFGWSGEGVRVPDANTVWTADGNKLTPETPVTLRWSNGAGQTFVMRDRKSVV